VRLVAGAGALGVGGILRESMSGTAEGERFNKALENLTRTLGDQFAPWVREVTRTDQRLGQVLPGASARNAGDDYRYRDFCR
jgi:hypothetical protein